LSAESVSDLFQVTPRYLRSTNLERDFRDPKALENYVLTPHARECLGRLATGLRSTSTQRAWRLTGNYGSGKSSFALFLAHWFAGRAGQLSRSLRVDVKYDQFSIDIRPTYLPLLVTGVAEPMGKAILRALTMLFREQYSRGVKSNVQLRMETAITQKRVPDNVVVELIQAANEKLIKDKRGSGLLMLLDELGKFLEYAAYHPESQDIYLLQTLAEIAAKSGESSPLFVIGMLHQGFDAYAESLDSAAQREWEKVAGRFEEVLFNQPLSQVSDLIGAALRVRTTALPPFAREEAEAGLEAAVRLGWFGRVLSNQAMAGLATRIYPIHATVVPALVRVFNRFGQNERSLFSFLLSDEPFSLTNFSKRSIEPGACYRVPDFYDYVRANFGYRLSTQSYRSHWAEIESMVESFATSDRIELAIVKTVGVLNLLDHPELTATEEGIVACLAGPGGFEAREVTAAIARLHQVRRVLFRRGISGALCLWPHTSVDLEAAYEGATKAVAAVRSVGRALEGFLETRPLVARRHYIETGNLRYFDVRYVPLAQIAEIAGESTNGDGMVVVALCESKSECEQAETLARSNTAKLRKNLLIAVPAEPLSNQAGLVAEALRWDWVALNTPELNADRFAREEVSRQRANARQRLTNRIQDLIGLRSLNGARALKWFSLGVLQKITSGRQLLERLSSLCDELYPLAPCVKNELLNRHSLSSAAAGARMRLIDGILTHFEQPLLGMDPAKKPPEMSMYLSVLQRGRLHVETRKGWRLRVPERGADPLRLRPCLDAIKSQFDRKPDQKLRVSEILEYLSQPPYGVRDGLAPVLLAVYTALNHQELAFYEDGTFLREVSGDEFLRLAKVPESFEMQMCRIAGLRAEVFEALLKVLGIKPSLGNEPMVLDVVRPLCTFVASLPDYVRSTRRLSPEALHIREAILAAREPVTLLFKELPMACGLDPFPVGGGVPERRARVFSKQLKLHLDELRRAFESLLERMRAVVREEFDTVGAFEHVRVKLARRAESVVVLATEPALRALSLRLGDAALAEGPWLESLGSLLALQPPARWGDAEEDAFRRELHASAARFKALESIAFESAQAETFAEAFRLSLTKSDGSEVQEVVFVEKERVLDVDALAIEIQRLIGHDRALGMAALSRVVWSALKRHGGAHEC